VTDDTPPREAHKPLPLQLELPSRIEEPKAAVAVAPPPPRRRWTLPAPGRVRRAAIALALTSALATALVLYALPRYLRAQCIEDALRHGLVLTIEDVKLYGSGFRLLGIAASALDVPDARLVAPEVEIETSFFRPRKVTAKGAELTLQGRWSTIASALEKWGTTLQSASGVDWKSVAPLFTVGNSRVVWLGPIGENARFEASGVGADVNWVHGGATVHMASENVLLVVPAGTLGPWRLDVDRTPTSSRVCIALDPGVAGACTLLAVSDEDNLTGLDVVLPRSPLDRLGIPAALLGLHGKQLQLDTRIHYGALGAAKAEVSAKGGLHGIDVPVLPQPFDVSWELAAAGDPRTGIDLKQGRVAVGPLVGGLHGTLKKFEDGFRVDSSWQAGPVPCSAFTAPLGPGQPFDIAYQLRKLAEAAGLTKVAGNVAARAMLIIDSRDLGAIALEFTPDVHCAGAGSAAR
jgi:hypothetical protein